MANLNLCHDALIFCRNACIVTSAVLPNCWRYLKWQPSYCKRKIFNMAVWTINFNLSLSKVNCGARTNDDEHWSKHKCITRMVQLPAIEYVAACWVYGAGGNFCPGGLLPGETCTGVLLSGGSFARGDLCPFPPSSMRIAPSRLSVPSIVAWRTNKHTKKTKRQTRPHSSAGSRPPLPKFSGYVEVEAHYIWYFFQALYGSDPFVRR